MGSLMQGDILDDQLFRKDDHIGLSQVLQVLTLHSQIKTSHVIKDSHIGLSQVLQVLTLHS